MKGSAHQSASCTKLLVCAPSGGGKTGGVIPALCASGYKVRVMDFDNGLDIAVNYLTDPSSIYFKKNPKAIDNLEYLQFWSKAKNASGKLIPKPEAWQHAMQAMENWQDYVMVEKDQGAGKPPMRVREAVVGSSLGPVASWNEDCVLVIDSFSGMSDAAFEFTLQINARIGQGIRESDWGDAQHLLWEYIEQISSPEIRCNVILNCHIKDVSKENEPTMLMPNSIGKKLPKDLPTKFNTILELRKKDGKMAFHTRSLAMSGALPVKTSAPLKAAETYGIEWGIVEYFNAVRREKP